MAKRGHPRKKIYVKKKKEEAPVIPLNPETIVPEETIPTEIQEPIIEKERDDTTTTHEENHQQ